MCEVLNKEELEKKQSGKNNLFQKIGLSPKEPEPLTAEKAWCESTYGEGAYKAIALGQQGKKVVLADLDLGASNLHLVIGQKPGAASLGYILAFHTSG